MHYFTIRFNWRLQDKYLTTDRDGEIVFPVGRQDLNLVNLTTEHSVSSGSHLSELDQLVARDLLEGRVCRQHGDASQDKVFIGERTRTHYLIESEELKQMKSTYCISLEGLWGIAAGRSGTVQASRRHCL